jgi:F-type H+-transporting ATPase subunit epsilon
MKVKITKPDNSLYDGEAKLVQLPGTGGLFEILDNHAPIISSLGKGTLRLIDTDDHEQTFDIRGGVVKGQQNDLLILVQ